MFLVKGIVMTCSHIQWQQVQTSLQMQAQPYYQQDINAGPQSAAVCLHLGLTDAASRTKGLAPTSAVKESLSAARAAYAKGLGQAGFSQLLAKLVC